jgi:hypothetical protein
MLRDTTVSQARWRPWFLTCFPRIAWTYERAAATVTAECVTRAYGTPPYLSAPTDAPTCPAGACRPLTCRIASSMASAVAVLPLNLARHILFRESPSAHRLAAYSLLHLTPRPLRSRIDHHLAPAQRTAALKRRL